MIHLINRAINGKCYKPHFCVTESYCDNYPYDLRPSCNQITFQPEEHTESILCINSSNK